MIAVLSRVPLAAGESFTQEKRDRFGDTKVIDAVNGFVFASHAGTLYLEESNDGDTWTTVATVAVSAGVYAELLPAVLSKRWYRFKYTNGGTSQSEFYLIQQTAGIDAVMAKDAEYDVVIYPVGGALVIDTQNIKTFSTSPAAMAADTWVDMFNFTYQPSSAGKLLYIEFFLEYQVRATTATADTVERIRARNKDSAWVLISNEKTTTDLGTTFIMRTTSGRVVPAANIDSVPFEVAVQGKTNEADTLRLEVSSNSSIRAVYRA